jgi:hypothetical protein
MPLDNGASPPVRPVTETRSLGENGAAAETAKPDFELALDAALAPLDSIITGPRRRAEAVARARQQIHAAAEALVKAERRVVAALTPAQLRKEVLELITSHEALLDYIDDLERQPVIAGEVRRLRCRGEIGWLL